MIAKAIRSFPPRCISVALILLALGVFAVGCATYGYAARGPGPDLNTLPVDRMTPQETTSWSFLWGTVSHLWSPLVCAETDATGKCIRSRDPCDGHGGGEVHLSLAWYSVPLAVVTLGTVIPGKITVYCSTFVPPNQGP